MNNMCNLDLSSDFWNNRYLNDCAGWDMGEVSPPIKSYIDQLEDRDISILIPGAGNSYEAEYLHKSGFKNVVVVDIAAEPLKNLVERLPTFPEANLFHLDFFEFSGKFDLIIEQTFFCAIDKSLRANYAEQISTLLNVDGKLVGLMFDAPLNIENPPFGGSTDEYKAYFSPYFKHVAMNTCYNSHPSRNGREVWINIEKIIKPLNS